MSLLGFLGKEARGLAEELAGLSVKQLVDKGYPEVVAQKIASGELPMDPQSIATRQGQMGMTDERFLRGHSATSPPKSNQDMFMVRVDPNEQFPGATAHDIAESYARGGEVYDEVLDDYVTMPGEVTPLRTNANNFLQADAGGHDYTWPVARVPGYGEAVGSDQIAGAVKQTSHNTGLQGTRFESMSDRYDGYGEPTDIYNVLGSRDDVQIRHADRAAYDPDYNGSSIMGGLLAGGVGLGALSQSEDADAGLLHAGARGARDFTGRKPGDYKAPNLSKAGRSMPVVAQWSDELTKLKSVGADSHALENKLLDYLKGDGSNSNLHNWPGFAKRIDGGVNGPFYLNGMDVFYEELVELMPQHEDIIRGVISRRQGGGKGRDFNKYESKHSAQNAQARNIGGGGVLDESAYQQKVRRAESDPNLRVPRYTDPIVRRNENTFVDPKTGRKKARQVSFAVGDPGTGTQFAQALFDNYETGKQAQMDKAGLTKDPMQEYGEYLPWKQNIVTGEGSPAVPDFLRNIFGGIFGVKSGLQQGIVNPNDLTDVFL